jgi:hypothetical protein
MTLATLVSSSIVMNITPLAELSSWLAVSGWELASLLLALRGVRSRTYPTNYFSWATKMVGAFRSCPIPLEAGLDGRGRASCFLAPTGLP